MSVKSDIIYVYTDGACPGNGKPSAKAGCGVWFEGIDLKPISYHIQTKPTNQRAELLAVILSLESLEKVKVRTPVNIYTDSMYVYKIATSWMKTWKACGWRRARNKPVLNLDLVKRLDKLVGGDIGELIEWNHTRSHQPEPPDKQSNEWRVWLGNKKADELAVQGAFSG